ncbi:cardiomyopathy-associated protein 5 [Chanos chanos]|uniref:Cardiomyopathy-associated protein 5 n=1 Tax=Chanos chanos TaxID=29144 RepID=A0A6J2WTV0_CHACN|nr:cardiomyopathy-associated protein 5-like [Chanos chanos]
MDPKLQDESDKTDPELQELQEESSEAILMDDEDEIEELHNSLKEVVQDPSVKPKLQCLMVDPSFSMVTVQSEDSGIVWETASSRCSTPWASDASSTSESYNVEGSGKQGKIVIIMDEEKVIRKRKRTSSRGKLGERLKRPSSRLSGGGSAIGTERPAMTEVSVPNIRSENPEDGQPTESKVDKDQDLFNLISEGYEILNIVVPSRLPTVDEEDSTELADNLSYLEDTPKIKSKCKHHDTKLVESHSAAVGIDVIEVKEDQRDQGSSPAADNKQTKKDTTGDMDYLEKFTLLDPNMPEELLADDDEEEPERLSVQPDEPLKTTEEPSESLDDSFVIVTDVEILNDHLDDVFYGNTHEPTDESPNEDTRHDTSETAKPLKESGSRLFGSEEDILTPIFLSPGPPKIIDPILLEEPTALSFHYSDLYEDAVGDRRKDDDHSDAESNISEKSFKRRLSDSDDADGYLEKFILKDETPAVEDPPDVEDTAEDRTIWPQSKFELTGSLVRVREEKESEEEISSGKTNIEEKGEHGQAITEQTEAADFTEEEDCSKAQATEAGIAISEDSVLQAEDSTETLKAMVKEESKDSAGAQEVKSLTETVVADCEEQQHATEILEPVSHEGGKTDVEEDAEKLGSVCKTEDIKSDIQESESIVKEATSDLKGKAEVPQEERDVDKPEETATLASSVASESVHADGASEKEHTEPNAAAESQGPEIVTEELTTDKEEIKISDIVIQPAVEEVKADDTTENATTVDEPVIMIHDSRKELPDEQMELATMATEQEKREGEVKHSDQALAEIQGPESVPQEEIPSKISKHKPEMMENGQVQEKIEKVRDVVEIQTEEIKHSSEAAGEIRGPETVSQQDKPEVIEQGQVQEELGEVSDAVQLETEEIKHSSEASTDTHGPETVSQQDKPEVIEKGQDQEQSGELRDAVQLETEEIKHSSEASTDTHRPDTVSQEDKSEVIEKGQDQEQSGELRDAVQLETEEIKHSSEASTDIHRPDTVSQEDKSEVIEKKQVQSKLEEVKDAAISPEIQTEEVKVESATEIKDSETVSQEDKPEVIENGQVQDKSEEIKDVAHLNTDKTKHSSEASTEMHGPETVGKEGKPEVIIHGQVQDKLEEVKDAAMSDEVQAEVVKTETATGIKGPEPVSQEESPSAVLEVKPEVVENEQARGKLDEIMDTTTPAEIQVPESEKQDLPGDEAKTTVDTVSEIQEPEIIEDIKADLTEKKEQEFEIVMETPSVQETEILADVPKDEETKETDTINCTAAHSVQDGVQHEVIPDSHIPEKSAVLSETNKDIGLGNEMARDDNRKAIDDLVREDQIESTVMVLKDTHTDSIVEAPAKTEETEVLTPLVPTEPINKKEKSDKTGSVSHDLPSDTITETPEMISPSPKAAIGDSSPRVSPLVPKEGKDHKEANEPESILNDRHTDVLIVPERVSAVPEVEVEESSTMRVSPTDEIEGSDEEADQRMEFEDRSLFSPLRSFTPLEDLSGFGQEITEPEFPQYGDAHDKTAEELDYEMVSEKEVRQSEAEITKIKENKEHLELHHVEKDVLDHPADQSVEAEYEFVEGGDSAQVTLDRQFEEEGGAQAVDTFCLSCRSPISAIDKLFGAHQNHEVCTLDKAYDDIKNKLSEWISVLQERYENVEDFVSELELAYNSVEEHFKSREQAMEAQNEEVLKLVMDQYNEMSQAMEEEKKTKLEQLYDQIVSFQENIDSAKETLEKTAKDMDESDMDESDQLAFVTSSKDIDTRLSAALESTMSLELGPRGLPVFEDYAKGSSGNGQKNRQAIPVPQKPHLQAQEANSATSTSVTVYWTVNEGDIIDCFQVYCMEDPQGAISEEYRVTVKESYCTLEDLEPDKCYKVWVMAVNYTGCSLPSERLSFRTAPSVPVIQTENCTILWDSATLRWSSPQPSAVDSYTLEYCRQYACEGEGLRSISGIKACEHKVLLLPNENYLFYIKSVNGAGSSEQSEAALISTRGTRFHLLKETDNSVLQVSEDSNSVRYPAETFHEMSSLIECPEVLGELLPPVGHYYWETVVAGCKAYRIGVAYHGLPRDSPVGENSASWCLHCVPTSISCRFELLHNSVQSDIFVTDVPACIGTLLDFTQGKLFFFNTKNGQQLGSFQHKFTQPCHAVFGLENPGNLDLHMTLEAPEFAKHC